MHVLINDMNNNNFQIHLFGDDVLTGTFIYLPSNRGDSCPLRRYSMTSPDADWQTLVHQYLYDVVEGKQDKVVFLARQVPLHTAHFSPAHMGV